MRAPTPLPRPASRGLSDFFGSPGFKSFASNALMDLGYGLTRGTDLNQGFQMATQRTAEMQPARDAYATSEAEKAQRLEQLNKTVEYLRSQAGGATWADAVEGGFVDPKDAFKGWYEESQPKGPIKASAGDVFLDPKTFQPISSVPDPKAQAAADKEAFDRESGLAKEYAGTDPVKTYEAVKGGYERVRQGAMQNTGAGDMSLIYGFMKMQDPGSVVRESEFAMAAQAGSFGEQIQSMVSRVLSGERLPESVRQQFVQAADGLYVEATQNLEGINSQFGERATGFGVKPERFIRQPEVFEPLVKGGGWTEIEPGVRIRKK